MTKRIILFLWIVVLVCGDLYFLKNPSLSFLLISFIFIGLVVRCAKSPIVWLLFLLSIHALHWLFGVYFGRDVAPFDLYLFVTHIDETFDAMIGMPGLFLPPILAVGVGASLLIFLKGVRRGARRCRWIVWPLVLVLLVPMGGLHEKTKMSGIDANRRIPSVVRGPLMDVVLVIGESMACDENIVRRFQKLGGYARCIVSGAINTDVSIPLLLNGLNDPAMLERDDPRNLFALAKGNGYHTRFDSAQSAHNLRYIEPYLGLRWIDDYHDTPKLSRRPLYDMALLKGIDHLPPHPAFVVLHQIGEHAPYIFFPGAKSDDPGKNYAKSLDYSFGFYRRLIEKLDESGRPYVLMITSDHGEFRGQKGRWGHNVFTQEVYTVPFFIRFDVDPWAWYEKVRSHGDLYRYIRYLLGYGSRFDPLRSPYVVCGTMQSGEDGSIRVDPITR